MLEVNCKNIEIYLNKRHPSSKISFVGEGWTSLAYIVDRQVFRFPKISIEDYKRETKIVSVIRPYCTTQIPSIEIINDNGFEYSVHKLLEGKTWTLEDFERLDSFKQNLFAQDCAKFLFKLHSMPIQLFKEQIPTKSKISKPIILEKKEFYPLLLSRISEKELDKLYDVYLKSIDTFNPDLVILHKDFEGKNCVVDTNFRLCGVFDFGNTNIGDRVREFSFLYNPHYPTFLNKLLISYEYLSNIKISMNDLKDYLLRSAINSLPELYDERLASIRDKALDSRAKRFHFFLDEIK